VLWGRRKKEENEVQDEEATTAAGHPSPTTESGVRPEAAPPVAEGPGETEREEATVIRDRIIAVLKTVYDPEIPVDIYELGLIYGLEVTDDGEAHVTMTLTTPMCPVAETLPPEIEDKVRNVKGVRDVSLDLVWDPPWSVDMMSDAARLELNMM
jgi:FeS assembly SUF system protein